MIFVEFIVVLYCPAVLFKLLAPLSSITNSVALMPSVAAMLAAALYYHLLASSIYYASWPTSSSSPADDTFKLSRKMFLSTCIS